MIRVIDYPSPEVADMELPMVVSRMAVTELTLVSGGQVLGDATLQVKFGDIVTLVCEAVKQIIFPFFWQCPYIPLCPIGEFCAFVRFV